MFNLESLHACNPSFDIYSSKDNNYYVNLTVAGGEDAVKRMRRAIALSPNKPTYQLLSGHIGCGKSTELLRLKLELEQQGFCVIYCVADKYLPINQVGLIEIWLVMLRLILQQLERSNDFLGLNYVSNAIAEMETSIRMRVNMGNSTHGMRLEKILQALQDNDQQYRQLRHHLNLRKNLLLTAIEEATTMEIDRLKQLGKKGLVILVDNLDRLSLEQVEIIFSEAGKHLRQFQCHTIYTIPLLAISHTDIKFQQQFQKYGNAPILLSKLSLSDRYGAINFDSLNQLRQVVLARIIPNSSPSQRLEQISHVFDQIETLDQLCLASHGHLPYLLALLQGCLQQQNPPILLETVQQVIESDRHMRRSTISDRDHQVLQEYLISNNSLTSEVFNLCRRLLVFENHDANGYWFSSPALKSVSPA